MDDQVAWVAVAIHAKVFQGRPEKKDLALHCARVAVRALWQWGDLPLDVEESDETDPLQQGGRV